MIWLIYVVAILWGFLCWLEMYNTNTLNPFSSFVTGFMAGMAWHQLLLGEYVIAAAELLPAVVILISYLVLRFVCKPTAEI